MIRTWAAAPGAAVLCGVVTTSFAGSVQVTEVAADFASIAPWTDAPAHACHAPFDVSEKSLVDLALLPVAPADSFTPVSEAATTASSGVMTTSCEWHGLLVCPVCTAPLDGLKFAPKAVRPTLPVEPLAMPAIPAALHEPLTWTGEQWTLAQSPSRDGALRLSLDSPPVALPNAFVMGAIGLVSLAAARFRAVKRARSA